MTNTPLVSVIIPVYNGEKYVKDAIDSTLSQTYQNIEVIVCNDGSKDGTDSIVSSYEDKIKYLKKENGGVATALNLLVKNAKGKYVAWLSHDDMFLPDRVQAAMNELEKEKYPDNVIYFSNFIVRDITNNTEYKWKKSEEEKVFKNSHKRINILRLLFRGELHGCTLLIPKKAFEEVGLFDTSLKTTQDYHLWYKFVDQRYIFRYIDEPLLVTRHHEDQDSKKKGDVCVKEGRELYTFATELFFDNIIKSRKKDFKFFRSYSSSLRLTELEERLNKARKKHKLWFLEKLGIKI